MNPKYNFATVSVKAAPLIKKYEGYRNAVYKCPAGVLTIGYGHTRDIDCLTETQIDQEGAEILLSYDMYLAYCSLVSLLGDDINKLTTNNLAALLSFVFNVGANAFAKSYILILIRNGDMANIAEQFKRWVHAKGVVLEGLVTRRNEEKELYLLED